MISGCTFSATANDRLEIADIGIVAADKRFHTGGGEQAWFFRRQRTAGHFGA